MITVGEVLKKAREKKKMNISEVQSITRIVSRYIEALENNKFDDLPGDIYVKGFLKNISEVLELNPKEVIELYRLQKAGIVGSSQNSNTKNKVKQKNLFSRPAKDSVVKEEKEEIISTDEQEDNTDEDDVEIVDTIDDEDTEESHDNVVGAEKIDEVSEIKSENKVETLSQIIEKKPLNTTRQAPKYSTQISPATKKKMEQYDLYSAESALLMLSREDISQNNSRRNRNRILIIAASIILVIALIGFVFRNNISYLLFRGKNDGISTNVQRNIVDTVANQNVKVGDIVYFKPLGISATIKFISIGNVVRVNINGSDLSLSKSNPIVIDLNSNGVNDFRMTLIEVYEDLATVRMERLEENQMVNSSLGLINDTDDTNENDTLPVEVQAQLGSSDINIINGEIYIETDVEKQEIKVDITAKRFVYVRYFIDSERPATVNLLSGRSLNLEARDVIMLTIGNVAEVVVRINGKVVSLGEFGETVNKTIKWVKNVNDSTKFNLVVSDTK